MALDSSFEATRNLADQSGKLWLSRVPTAPESLLSERRVIHLLLLATLIVSIPSKAFYYLAPIALAAYCVFFAPYSLSWRRAGAVLGLCYFTYLSLVVGQFRGDTVSLSGFMLGLVTLAPWAVLYLIRPAIEMRWERTESLAVAASWFVIIQGLLGVLQFAVTGRQDMVSGTMGLNDLLTGQVTISQVAFTFNVFSLLIFLIPFRRLTIVRAALVTGILVAALAQSGHQTLFFMGALIVAFARLSRFRSILAVVTMTVLLAGAVTYAFPYTWKVARAWGENIFLREFPKTLILKRGVERVGSDGKVALLGTGLGQYTSRAALFASGEYGALPFSRFIASRSSYFDSDVVPLMALHRRIGQGSAIAQPYFSIITVLLEWGALLFLWLVVTSARLYGRLGKFAKHDPDPVRQDLARALRAFMLFLILCSFIENYLELVQAIMLPALIFVVAASTLDRRGWAEGATDE